jgi:sodium/potassium-transporting ATPase subunit alpha
VGSALCFVAYGLRAPSAEHPANDNLYLGTALVGVALVTGFFSYYQQKKSLKIMHSFDVYLPQNVLTLRDGIKRTVQADQESML